MKSKILVMFAMFVLIAGMISPMILAEDDLNASDITSEQPGQDVEDDSGIGWDRVKMGLTFNKQKKAELALKIAQKHMARATKFEEQGKTNQSQQALEKHDWFLEKAENYSDEAIDGNPEAIKKQLAKNIVFQNKLEAHKEKAAFIKSRILERQAERMNETQLAHMEQVFSQLDNRTERAQIRLEQREDNLRAKYKVLTNKTDEEINQELAEFQAAFQKAKIERQERIQAYEQNETALKERIRARTGQ